VLGVDEVLDEMFPIGEVGSGGLDAEAIDHEAVDLVAPEVEGAFVDGVFDIAEGDDVLGLDVAEHGDLAAVVLVEFVLGATDDDVGLDPDLAQLGDRLLGRFGFDFSGGANEGKEGDVDEADIFAPDLERELPEGFEEEVAFNIADCATDLGDDDIDVGIPLGEFVEALFDLVGDVGDELHRFAEVVAAALAFDDILEDLAGSEVVEPGENAVGEALVVAEVEVGLRAVVEHVNLAMLEGRHRAGVHVEVGIELLEGDLEATVLKKGSNGCGGQALSEGGDHAAGDEDVFHAMITGYSGFAVGGGIR
jgi:hypothetical protein